MEIPTYLIFGDNENVMKVLDKIPNKQKLFNIYLYNTHEPLIEYGFNLFKNNDTIQIKIIICPNNNILNNLYFKNLYLKNITGLIFCCNNNTIIDNYKKLSQDFNKENIYIWFNIEYINKDIYEKDIHYLFTDNWIDTLFKFIEYDNIFDYQCQIL